MAWTTPRTWVAAELVAASTMNTHVRDNFRSVLHPYGTADLTGNQAISTTSEVSLFAAAPSITGGDLDANGRLYLRLIGDLLYNTGAGDDFTVRVKLGGTTHFTWVCDNNSWSANRQVFVLHLWVDAQGSTSSQRLTVDISSDFGGWGRVSSTPTGMSKQGTTVGSINMGSTQTLDVTAQPAASSANLAIRGLQAEMLIGSR